MKYLSPHFTLDELVFSQMAVRQGIDNTPSPEVIANLRAWCQEIGEPVRALLDSTIVVDSGYRCPALNAAVGSTSVHSDHIDGNAVDVRPRGWDVKVAFEMIRRSAIPYKQLIVECGEWLHISRGEPHREALIASGSPGKWTYERVV